ESVGRVTSSTVKFYIDRQEGKHQKHQDADMSLHSIEGVKPTKTVLKKEGLRPRITRKELTLASFM
ncbi:MAG: hypothetical protein ACE5KV_08590, partial [Thermoplasmata archaeon]